MNRNSIFLNSNNITAKKLITTSQDMPQKPLKKNCRFFEEFHTSARLKVNLQDLKVFSET